MPPVTKTLGEGTQSVLLTVAILECLAHERQPVSLSDLASSIGTSKSRVFRHLRTLLACGYVAQSEAGGQYGVGPRFLVLCRPTNERHDLGELATTVMERLCEQFRHSVIVSGVERDGVVVIKSMSGNGPVVVSVRVGTLLPFDQSAQGKVAMVFAPASFDVDAPVDRAQRRFAETSAAEFATIRRTGIAAAQMREGLLGLAAPLFDARGKLAGTLAMLNTAMAMKKREAMARVALREAATVLSSRLGYQRQWPPASEEPE